VNLTIQDGIPDSLKRNLTDLRSRYKQDVLVVEYSQLKQQVNDIVFSMPDNKMKGTFIWEPLNTGEPTFGRDGTANDFMKLYSDISKKYNISQ
jgi:arabinogalactan endo-1,4-beta-galactosidase